MKRFIDDEGDTRERLQAVARTSEALRDCLLREDRSGFVALIETEWENRKRLARGVSNPGVERIMDAVKAAGGLASKLCGAGGGGCMLSVVDPGRREAVLAAIRSERAVLLDFDIDFEGLRVERRTE